MDIKQLPLPGPGVLTTRVPDDLFARICEQIKAPYSQISQYNSRLVGQIENEFDFTITEDFDLFIRKYYAQYVEYFGIEEKIINEFSAWTNFQKATEYNPVHLHTATASWVLWVSIPYLLEDEDRLPNSANAKCKKNSRFEFIYSGVDGMIRTHNLDIDKSWQGIMVMFPSTLRHCVYPFYTSDEYRISLAGNIYAS